MTRRTLLQRAEGVAQNLACGTFGDWYDGAIRGWLSGYRAGRRSLDNERAAYVFEIGRLRDANQQMRTALLAERAPFDTGAGSA